jgi:hypothetical protein
MNEQQGQSEQQGRSEQQERTEQRRRSEVVSSMSRVSSGEGVFGPGMASSSSPQEKSCMGK